MKSEKLITLFKQAADPDHAAEALATLFTEVEGMEESVDTLTADKTTADERIRSLQDTNMKLFLKTAGEVPDDKEEPELTPEQEFDKLFTEKVLGGSK